VQPRSAGRSLIDMRTIAVVAVIAAGTGALQAEARAQQAPESGAAERRQARAAPVADAPAFPLAPATTVKAAEPEREPGVAIVPSPKQDAPEASVDLVSALRNFRGHLRAWERDPYGVSLGMLLGHDTIAVMRLRFP
jgi:hypothetical protein